MMPVRVGMENSKARSYLQMYLYTCVISCVKTISYSVIKVMLHYYNNKNEIMKNYQKKLPRLIHFIIIVNSACAQDIHFSQFYEAPLYRNPAFAGIVNGDIRVQAIFRSQWNSFVNAYKTGSLNAEYKMPVGKGEDFVTSGFESFFDRAGSADLTTTIFTPVLNYHKSLSNERNMYLSAAFMGGIVA